MFFYRLAFLLTARGARWCCMLPLSLSRLQHAGEPSTGFAFIIGIAFCNEAIRSRRVSAIAGPHLLRLCKIRDRKYRPMPVRRYFNLSNLNPFCECDRKIFLPRAGGSPSPCVLMMVRKYSSFDRSVRPVLIQTHQFGINALLFRLVPQNPLPVFLN